MKPKTTKGKARCFIAKAGNVWTAANTLVEAIEDGDDKSTTYYDDDGVELCKQDTLAALGVEVETKFGAAKKEEVLAKLSTKKVVSVKEVPSEISIDR